VLAVESYATVTEFAGGIVNADASKPAEAPVGVIDKYEPVLLRSRIYHPAAGVGVTDVKIILENPELVM